METVPESQHEPTSTSDSTDQPIAAPATPQAEHATQPAQATPAAAESLSVPPPIVNPFGGPLDAAAPAPSRTPTTPLAPLPPANPYSAAPPSYEAMPTTRLEAEPSEPFGDYAAQATTKLVPPAWQPPTVPPPLAAPPPPVAWQPPNPQPPAAQMLPPPPIAQMLPPSGPGMQAPPANIVVNVAPGGQPQPYVEQKSKVVAALLAFFLGGFGIHAFYLGNTGMGIILLAITLISFPLLLLLVGFLSLFAVGIICIVQAILYIVATDYDFQQKYVIQKRWF